LSWSIENGGLFLRVARDPGIGRGAERNAGIASMIAAGQSWNSIQAAHRLCGRGHHRQDREAREASRTALALLSQ
jgi:hypothetical protein